MLYLLSRMFSSANSVSYARAPQPLVILHGDILRLYSVPTFCAYIVRQHYAFSTSKSMPLAP